MTPPTATPRTDAFEIKAAHDAIEYGKTWQPMVFARTLETELAAAQQEAAHYMSVAQKATDELARLRAELAVAENWVLHHQQHAEDLIGENVKLRADLERFTGHGLLDCHAICDHRDAAVAERDRLRAELTDETNLHAQTRTVVEELNTICTDLKNAGGPPFVRSEAIRLLRDDQAQLRGMLTAERERVRVLRDALENLRDEQNGAPLCTRETEWKEAMDKPAPPSPRR